MEQVGPSASVILPLILFDDEEALVTPAATKFGGGVFGDIPNNDKILFINK